MQELEKMDPKYSKQVYTIDNGLDPSGTMIEYQAKGIGAADEGIQSILKEQYKADLTVS